VKAIQKPSAAAGFAVIDAPVPQLKQGEVLIKVLATSICGTDLHITQWDEWSANRMKPPIIFGHEFCGVVEQVAEGVFGFTAGDYVSAEMHLLIPTPEQIEKRDFHTAQNGDIFGVDRQGCFAEYITLPQWQLVKLPADLKPEVGACLDSLGNGIHAVSKGDVSGKTVLVTGCGPIGLFAIAAAKAMGATAVYASDLSPYRKNLARQAGADTVFDPSQVTVSDAVKDVTGGKGIDVVLEMSGNAHAIKDAFKALKIGGTYVMMGIPGRPVELDLNTDIIFKEARVIGCNGREIFRTWEIMLDLLTSGKLNIDFMITHRFPLTDFGQGIELLKAGECGKVILTP